MLKRIIDILSAIIILISSLPFIIIILFIVFIITGDSPLISQIRKITLDKKSVKIFKIRTIKSSKQFDELEKICDNIFIKIGFDKHVPLFCNWLRETGIDEIPQVFNILKGEMSLVGPRPFPLNDLELLKESEPEYYYRRTKINSKPGITGYWQIFGNREEGTKNLIECDEIYEMHEMIFFDLKIMLRTFLILITAKHSNAIVQTKSRNRVYKLSGDITT